MQTSRPHRSAPAFALFGAFALPTRPPRARTHSLAHIQRTCANRAPGVAVAPCDVLGGGAVGRRASEVGQGVGCVEHCMGCGELCVVGRVSSSGVMHVRCKSLRGSRIPSSMRVEPLNKTGMNTSTAAGISEDNKPVHCYFFLASTTRVLYGYSNTPLLSSIQTLPSPLATMALMSSTTLSFSSGGRMEM